MRLKDKLAREERLWTVYEMAACGHNLTSIGKKVGLSASQVCRLLQRARMLRDKAATEQIVERLDACLNRGKAVLDTELRRSGKKAPTLGQKLDLVDGLRRLVEAQAKLHGVGGQNVNVTGSGPTVSYVIEGVPPDAI